MPRRGGLRKPYCLRLRRSRYLQYMLVLTLSFLSSFITFSITFYRSSGFLPDILSIFSFSSSDRHHSRLYPYETPENYQPRDFAGKRRSLTYDYYAKYNDFNYLQPKTLTYTKRLYSKKIPILFRFPQKTSLSALLLIFHSCKTTAYDWFNTTERQRIIGAAIDLGYVCLVFQATDKDSQCWSNDADIYENRDVQMVFKGLESFYKEYPQLVSLPRFTFGSSSGGIFSSIFAINQRFPIQGQIIHISIILPEILYTYVKAKNYPPTACIHMLRDIEFASESRINISRQIFTEQNIPFNSFPIEPISMTYKTFSDRIPSISQIASNYIYDRLRKYRWLNPYSFLKYNPRRKLTWQSFLLPFSNNDVNDEQIFNDLNRNKQIIIKFLNTIYGEHEISYERSYEALKWLKELYLSSHNETKLQP